MVRISVDENLIEDVKKAHPEISRLSPTDVADWALRKTLKEAKQ
jgi:hypothetical protein